jgi:hypothetical protein
MSNLYRIDWLLSPSVSRSQSSRVSEAGTETRPSCKSQSNPRIRHNESAIELEGASADSGSQRDRISGVFDTDRYRTFDACLLN